MNPTQYTDWHNHTKIPHHHIDTLITPPIPDMAIVTINDPHHREKTNPVFWETDQVTVQADDFYIIAQGDTFLGNLPVIVNDNYSRVDDSTIISTSGDSVAIGEPVLLVNSDPGDSSYCSLELEWKEHNVEMRMFIYFDADETGWWSHEIRTYNGNKDGDWLYYSANFFRSPKGTAFNGTISLANYNSPGKYSIYFENLKLQPFKK